MVFFLPYYVGLGESCLEMYSFPYFSVIFWCPDVNVWPKTHVFCYLSMYEQQKIKYIPQNDVFFVFISYTYHMGIDMSSCGMSEHHYRSTVHQELEICFCQSLTGSPCYTQHTDIWPTYASGNYIIHSILFHIKANIIGFNKQPLNRPHLAC